MSIDAIDYARPGPLTSLDDVPRSTVGDIAGDSEAICRLIPHLVIHRDETAELGLSQERLAESGLRPVSRIVEALLAQDDAPLTVAREPRRRVVGTCRDFAVLSCALLRHRGIAARARCGFATYFQPGQGLDHWITEHWSPGERRWVRVDSQVIGGSLLEHPEDLREGQFLTGGEAWLAHREGRIDADTFGVHGTENFGPAEIRANAIRDLAALNKVEMLPWDEWGRMVESYEGRTGADFDELMDVVAAVCAGDDRQAVAGLYATDELRVPAELIS